MSLESGRTERVPRITAESKDINLEDPLAQEALTRLQAIIDKPESKIDSGGAGKVYRLAGGACIKVLDQRHEAGEYDKGNSLTEEARFNQFLSTFSEKGVRSPRYIGRIIAKSPKQMEAILMEELRAVNLQHVLNGKAALPESFDPNAFLDGLSAYVAYLNDKLNIAHGDLEPRNVMVDTQTGMPRVIDFGRSSWMRRMSDEEKKKKTDEDWRNVLEIEKKVEEYWGSLTKSK